MRWSAGSFPQRVVQIAQDVARRLRTAHADSRLLLREVLPLAQLYHLSCNRKLFLQHGRPQSQSLRRQLQKSMLMLMSTITKAEILNMSVPERIQLAEDIWDTIAEVPEAIPLSDDEKAELDRRLDAYHRDPTAGSPWEAVRRKIRDQV